MMTAPLMAPFIALVMSSFRIGWNAYKQKKWHPSVPLLIFNTHPPLKQKDFEILTKSGFNDETWAALFEEQLSHLI